MNALVLAVAIFCYWGLLGFATISSFPTRHRILQGILLSPAIGIAVVLLPVFFLSRAGFPVKEFALHLLAGLALASVAILAVKRPIFPFRRVKWLAVVIIVALLLVAWPMFEYGLNWASYSNDDMANYCLGAARFLQHGFFEPPDLGALFQGRDYSEAYWYLYAPGKVRPGSELTLAIVWGVTGLNAHQIFMPVIVALDLALISAVGGMVAGVTRNRLAPLIAMSLLAVSPLTSLGSLYQLIGQVGGLALLVPSVSMLLRVPQSLRPGKLLLASIPTFLTLAGLFVWYPEVLPFLGIGWFIYASILAWHDKKAGMKLIFAAGAVGLLLLAVLQGTIKDVLGFLLFQAAMAGNTHDLSTVMFPYMLVPSGIPLLWGIVPMGGAIGEPLVSASIAFGLFLSFWFLKKLPAEVVSASSPAIITMVMLCLAAKLFIGNIDFGLFKLAMFIQPFLLAVVAMRLAEPVAIARQWWKQGLVVGTVALCLSSQMAYVKKSTGEFLGSMNEVPYSSSKAINQQFSRLFTAVKDVAAFGFIADTSHLVIAKYQALYTTGTSVIFPSKQFFQNISGILPSTEKKEIMLGDVANWFRKDKNLSAEEIGRRWLINENDKYTPFNNYAGQGKSSEYFSAKPMAEIHDRLSFIHSNLGIHYYFLSGVEQGDRRNTAFFPIENDPMFPGNTFSGVGRYLLLMDINPTAGARMVMEATTTVMKNFESELPQPVIYGAAATPVEFVGRGSGRVFSAPVQPVMLDEIPYLSIDMGRDGKQFKNRVSGLMKLYGTRISQDSRRMTAFARDISLISKEDYSKLTPPSSLAAFPSDLNNRSLEYSGIYEDGWISEKSFFVLAQHENTLNFVIKGVIPQLDKADFKSIISIRIDGKFVTEQELGVGNFSIKLPVKSVAGNRRVDLSFDRFQRLPGDDGRPSGGKIDFIGFVAE